MQRFKKFLAIMKALIQTEIFSVVSLRDPAYTQTETDNRCCFHTVDGVPEGLA